MADTLVVSPPVNNPIESPTPEVLSRDNMHDDSITKSTEKSDVRDVIESRGLPHVDDVHDKAVEYLAKHNIVELFQVMSLKTLMMYFIERVQMAD